MNQKQLDRFWAKVDKSGECWIWIGYKNPQGYGRLGFNKKLYYAHRISYELENGKFNANLHVLHKCDNPSCVNSQHLFLGTDQDNADDRGRKGRSASVCGSKNGNSKLKEKDILEIRESSLLKRELAIKYKVNKGTIALIISRKSWKHI